MKFSAATPTTTASKLLNGWRGRRRRSPSNGGGGGGGNVCSFQASSPDNHQDEHLTQPLTLAPQTIGQDNSINSNNNNNNNNSTTTFFQQQQQDCEQQDNDIESDFVRSRLALENENKKLQKMMESVIPKHLVSKMRDDLMAPTGYNSNFEKYYLEYYESVSILFADIVGFTKISSHCSAKELVMMLNELFGRFDMAADANKCLRIKILGDCYYCVSGVPANRGEPHAKQCVEMGLDMIDILAELAPHLRAPSCEPAGSAQVAAAAAASGEKTENGTPTAAAAPPPATTTTTSDEKRLKMRIGIHTGQVLCGIMGKKKWQFDVHSNDVKLANHMEQSGVPGRVHITEATLRHLGTDYEVEPANGRERDDYIAQLDIETYFVTTPSERRKDSAIAAGGGFARRSSSTAGLLSSLSGSAGNAGQQQKSTRAAPREVPQVVASAPAAQQVASVEMIVDRAGKTSVLRGARGSGGGSDMRQAPAAAAAATSDKQRTEPRRQPLNQAAAALRSDSGAARSRELPVADTIVIINQSNETVSLLAAREGGQAKSGALEDGAAAGVAAPLAQPDEDNGIIMDAVSDVVVVTTSDNNNELNAQTSNNIINNNNNNNNSATSLVEKQQQQPNRLLHIHNQTVTTATATATNARPMKSKSQQNIRMETLTSSLTVNQDLAAHQQHHSIPSGISQLAGKQRFKRTTRALINASHFIRTIDPPFANLDSESTNSVNIDKIICDTKAGRGQIKDVHKWSLKFKEVEMSKLYHEKRKAATGGAPTTLSQHNNGGWLRTGASTSGGAGCCYLLQPLSTSHKQLTILTVLALCTTLTLLAHVTLIQPSQQQQQQTQTQTQTQTPSSPPPPISAHQTPTTPITTTDQSLDATNNNLSVSDSGGGGSRDAPSTSTKVYQIISLALLTLISLALAMTLAYRLHQAELNKRIDFVLRQKAIKDKARLFQMRECNRFIFFNILPKHVAKYFLESQKLAHKELYSKSYDMVGVSFATVTNFNEFYEEEEVNDHGKGCLNLLNEILCDFDELLDREQFKMIDKIKTIGTTYMAAIGLCPRHEHPFEDNPSSQSELGQQLRIMLEFIMEMRECLKEISKNSFHEYKMRAGINIGPVTAGVIGATKPQYDIWGNTVNVASRMESTCEPNEIQITEDVYRILKNFYNDLEFRCRGSIDVKGKGKMTTYYVGMPTRSSCNKSFAR